MNIRRFPDSLGQVRLYFTRTVYAFLGVRAHSVIILGALFCTLGVKLFHCFRVDCVNEYFWWVTADISVLLAVELVLAACCFLWPRKYVFRMVLIFAAVVCTWSVMNAGWLIRTGTQILPTVLLPLFRDPLNSLAIIFINLLKMPATAAVLLVPSAVALVFFFFVLARPALPVYRQEPFLVKTVISAGIVLTFVFLGSFRPARTSTQIAGEHLRYNCQLTAVTNLLFGSGRRENKLASAQSARRVPALDEMTIPAAHAQPLVNHNVVIIVLEGVQYAYTSLAYADSNLTPYLLKIAGQGVEFTNARATVTHTTKALFSLLTGRFPSVSQDLAEAVPATKPYMSIATILGRQMNFRTAFFQSAKGNFEARPSLVHNLGFDNFFAREDLSDPNGFIGYLGCDEFLMLKGIVNWIKSDDRPFLLTALCSITHDPYEVPKWFAKPADQPIDRYRQSIAYTDAFIEAFDKQLALLGLTDNTVFCIIGDHGEAFGEHGLLGHERIPFDEALRIPWLIRAPTLVPPGKKVNAAVSSIDLVPTQLALLGFDVGSAGFDGLDALCAVPGQRRVYFSGWMSESPAGFVEKDRKFIYNPAGKMATAFDLSADPAEKNRFELTASQTGEIVKDITRWRRDSMFNAGRRQTGENVFYGSWHCRWDGRVCSARYRPAQKN
ncbi:MAG TPA: LTA synthase family protein [Sedimentisphaerales bacterium]|nr:LTA synthase family protein [Sedimentisphaerales bacterium]